jgi:signal transduction histidine kinase
VADTGAGIAPDDLSRLFERFWQARRSRRGGAGLGLAIARGIVQAHGAQLAVESQPGRGSTFYFDLA